jgi:hypothetical protein
MGLAAAGGGAVLMAQGLSGYRECVPDDLLHVILQVLVDYDLDSLGRSVWRCDCR